MNPSTRHEGSRHHIGGPRVTIPLPPCGIAEGVACPACQVVGKVAVLPGVIRCLACGAKLKEAGDE